MLYVEEPCRTTENSHSSHEVPLDAENIRGLCTLWRSRLVGTPIFESTVDDRRYRYPVLQYVALLELDGCDCWLQQDGTTCHTANDTSNISGTVVVTIPSLETFGNDVPLI